MNRRRRAIAILLFIGLLLLVSMFAALQAHRRQYRLGRQLIAALKRQDADTARVLVEAGADPNTPYLPPPPPTLHTLWAYLRHKTPGSDTVNHHNLTAYTMACGANIVYIVGGKFEGLLTPIRLDSTSLIRSMLRHGAQVNQSAGEDLTPLQWAVSSDHPNTVRLLLESGAKVNARCKDRFSASMYLPGKSPEIARLLLTYGADVNAQSDTGTTPLSAVLHSPYPEVVRLLLDRGADVNVCDREGYTPLMGATSSSTEVLRMLLDRGADVNARAKDGTTPLIAFTQDTDASATNVRLLIEHGADVNARNQDGETPLIKAVESPVIDAKIVQILLSHRADPNLHAPGQPTALQLAHINKRPDLAKLLQRAGAKN